MALKTDLERAQETAERARVMALGVAGHPNKSGADVWVMVGELTATVITLAHQVRELKEAE